MTLNKNFCSNESRREIILRHPILTIFLALTLVTTVIDVRADSRIKSSENLMLKYMSELHPMGKIYARRSGDLNSDRIPEFVRVDRGGTQLLVEDNKGNLIGSINFKEPVQEFSIEDVNGDGLAEILVLTDGLQRLRAYDQYGNQLIELKQYTSKRAENYYQLALRRSLDYLYAHLNHTKPSDSSSLSTGNGTAYDCKDEKAIEWDGVTVNDHGWRVIMGTNGADIIRGTNGNDLIIGLSGSDFICGRGGDDWIYGDERLFNPPNSGGSGVDIIYAGSGNDVIFGGAEWDFLLGGSGNDTLYGGLGNDFLSGDENVLPGQPGYTAADGADFLVGMLGGDTYQGGAGDDVVNATAFSEHFDEDSFSMNAGELIGNYNDTCYVYVQDAFNTEGCESVVITDWH